MLTITAVVGSVLALIYIRLAFNVINLRQKHRVSLGAGDRPDLEKAIRAHGNFAEYVPIALILLAVLEYNRGALWMLGVCGLLLVLGRGLHAYGMVQEGKGVSAWRVRGMVLTITAIIGLAVGNLWVVIRGVM